MVKKPFNGKVRVDKRLESLIPPLEKEQLKVLEDSLLEEGRAHSPLWLWGDLLVDGHHRFKLCQKHKLPYETIQVYESSKTLDDVEYRMKRDAIGQRNLTPGQQSKFRAEMVAYHISKGKSKKAAVLEVAKDSEVSERQVYRDVARTEIIEKKIDETAKEVASELSDAALKKMASLPKPKQKAAVAKAGGSAKALSQEVKKPTDLNEAAKKVMSIAHQHRDKLVRAIDDYSELVPNRSEQTRLIKLVQSVVLWSSKK